MEQSRLCHTAVLTKGFRKPAPSLAMDDSDPSDKVIIPLPLQERIGRNF